MTGTAQYATALSDSLGDMGNELYGRAYETERANQLNAAGSLAALQETGFGRAMQGFGAAADLFNTDANRSLNSAQQMFNMFQGANATALNSINALPNVYKYGAMPGETLGQVGAIIDQQNQAVIDADVEKYNYNANADINMLNMLANIYNGQILGGGQYGTVTNNQTSLGPRISPFMQALGIAATAAGGLKTSDVRLKADARPIGEDERGVKWWEYRYIWDRPDSKRIGVMAQELIEKAPQFVGVMDNGFLGVDYAGLAQWEGDHVGT
jgi:hypothetical protein